MNHDTANREQISLMRIAEDLEELVRIREEAISEGDADVQQTVDRLIAEYADKAPQKIDAYAGLIRKLENDRNLCIEESRRLTLRAERMKAFADRLKANMLAVMQRFDIREMSSPTNTFLRRTNGGLQKLDTDMETLPLTFVKAKTVMIPDTSAIREALKQGTSIPGVTLHPRGERVDLE